MPFPNFHAARVKDPSAFEEKSFRNKEITEGVQAVMGKLKGENTMTIQSYRFSKEKFTEAQAKEWLKRNEVKFISFEKAEDMKEEKKKKKDCARIDFLDMPSDGPLTERFQVTPEGFLKGRAICTNIGVFTYIIDGKPRRELRLPEEVFNYDSMKTLQMIPVTNNHPKGSVNSENAKKVQVGFTGEEVRKDEYHLSIPITITESVAVADAQSGKRALSCGYLADIEEKAGNWMGVEYDAIQRNIRYNHVALVEKPRAGDNAYIKMDSFEQEFGVQEIDSEKQNQQGEKVMLKKFKIDGVEYEAEAPVIVAYTHAKEELEKVKADSAKEVETLKKDKTSIEAERDQLKDENTQLKKDAEEAKKKDPGEIEKAVQSRLVVLDAAKRAKVEVKLDASELQIKKEIVAKLFPSSKEKLEKADETYINVRFDGAIEYLDTLEAEHKELETILNKDNLASAEKADADKPSATTSYQKMVKRDQEAWMKKSEEAK